MRRPEDKLEALLKDKWVDPPAAQWAAWAALAVRWAAPPKAKWVALPRAKWVAWVHLPVRWAVPPKAKWVDPPAAKWAAWAALSVGWVALLPVDKRVAWVSLAG